MLPFTKEVLRRFTDRRDMMSVTALGVMWEAASYKHDSTYSFNSKVLDLPLRTEDQSTVSMWNVVDLSEKAVPLCSEEEDSQGAQMQSLF